jgi:SNF2 family DNA or RNA helicase
VTSQADSLEDRGEVAVTASPPLLFRHQQELLDRTWELPAWAIFFQTGVGKSAPTVHTAVRLHQAGRIDGVVIVAPNMVHRNWITDEVRKHVSVVWKGLDWHSSRGKAQDRAVASLLETSKGTLPWLAITYDGLITPRGRKAVLDFLAHFTRVLLVIDEGSRVKNPEALRTKKVAALRKLSKYVRLLNGTPTTQAPTEIYAQMKLLDDLYWVRHGIGSYAAFKTRFCVFKKIVIGGEDDREANELKVSRRRVAIEPHDADPEGIAAYEQLDLGEILEQEASSVEPLSRQPSAGRSSAGQVATTGRTINVIVGYRELDKLHEMIQPLSTRLTKEQAGLNLPPKLYQRLVFELAPEQRRIYDQLRKEYMVELDNGVLITATLAMVRILRLQQVACGYLPNPDDPEGEPILVPRGVNPRLAAFMDWLEDIGSQQVIVWARFTRDVDLITRELGPPSCVRYDGQVSEKEKAKAIDLFVSGKRQFCVAKASSMGMGLTYVNSSISFYYSSTFSLLERLQSEDRQHRLGQHNPVTYVDLVAERTVDEKILRSLRENNEVARKVVGDEYRSWLEG